MHARKSACAVVPERTTAPMRATARTTAPACSRHGAGCTTKGICCDKALRWQWVAMSRQESYVATGFSGRQGGLGQNRVFFIAIEKS